MKISIITVCYNSALTIERTIKSVIGQNYNDLEYIIIDGGSTDGTQDIIRRYEGFISYWVSEDDQGIFDAMNKGIERATGEIIAFLNSDDWYQENILEEVSERFEQDMVQIVCGDIYGHRKEGVIRLHVELDELEELIWFKMGCFHPAMFVRRALFSQYGKFDIQYRIAGDYDWFLRVYNHHVKIAVIDKVLTNFCFGGISTREEMLLKTIEEQEKVTVTALENSKELTKEMKEKIKCEVKQYHSDMKYFYKMKRIIESGLLKNREGQQLLRNIFQEAQYSIFGCGTVGRQWAGILKNAGINITKIWDNDSANWGNYIDGVEVMNPGSLKIGDCMVIIASPRYEDEIEEQLNRKGFMHNTHYMRWSEFRKQIVDSIEKVAVI